VLVLFFSWFATNTLNIDRTVNALEDVASGREIRHAFRVTVRATNGYTEFSW